MDELITDHRINSKFALLLAINHTVVGAGAGVLLCGLLFYYPLGVAVGIALLFLAILTLFLTPGSPSRLWGVITGMSGSRARRGIVFVGCTIFFGLLYLLIQTGKPISPNFIIRTLGSVSALLTMLYTGLFISSVASVPLWNRRLVPVIFFLHSITSGYSTLVFLVSIPAESYDSIYIVELIEMGLLSITFLLTVLYVIVKMKSADSARESARILVKGEQKYFFLMGGIALGLIIPLALTGCLYFSFDFTGRVMFSVFLAIMISRILGDLSLRYSFLRGGIFEKGH